MPAIEYDGRYDGPGYSHPFWPRVGYPPPKAVKGYMQMCEVCCTDRQGRDLNGEVTLPHGNPHQTGAGFWPLTVIVEKDLYRNAGDPVLTCPECGSFRCVISIRPGGIGTGPGRTWRMGDPGGVQYAECQDCYAASDRPRYEVTRSAVSPASSNT